MAPIPIYTQSPVNPTKADGATPKTAESPDSRSTTRRQEATTTAAPPPTSTSPYPAPQPGARPAAPTTAPTPSVTATHVRTVSSKYAPAAATAGTAPGDGSPPPPQPGAVPTPPGRTSLPPPPKAGESIASQQGRETAANAYPSPTTMPPQMGIPPPTAAHLGIGTSTNAIPQGPRPTSLFEGDAGPGPGTNPPGYQQEAYQPAGLAPAGYSGYQRPSGGSGSGEDDEGAWAAAKKWAQSAGTSIAAAEDEVWRRINKS